MSNIINFNDSEYSTIVNLAQKVILNELDRLEISVLKFKIMAKNFDKDSAEMEMANKLQEKFDRIKQLIMSDNDLCIKLWLGLNASLKNLTSEEYLKKLKGQIAEEKKVEKISSSGIAIVDYSDAMLKKLLLANCTEDFVIADKTPLGELNVQFNDLMVNRNKFFMPFYQNLTINELPVPVDYTYEKADGCSLRQYALGAGSLNQKKRKHLSKAIEVSDNQFLINYSSEAFIKPEEIYSYKEAEKLQLVNEYINVLLECIFKNPKTQYCFGNVSEDAYNIFSSNGYDANNSELVRLHSIFAHYMTLDELESLKGAKRALSKFKI